MPTKRRNKPGRECRYQISVQDWRAHVTFNDYADANLFDQLPYEEIYYMILDGTLTETDSKKIKPGTPAEIVLHHGTYSRHLKPEEELRPIGYIEITNRIVNDEKEKCLLFRIIIPEKSFEHIRAYLSYRAIGEITIVGTDLKYRQGDAYYIQFNGGAGHE